jgi:hypothetical protein
MHQLELRDDHLLALDVNSELLYKNTVIRDYHNMAIIHVSMVSACRTSSRRTSNNLNIRDDHG